MSSAVVYGVIRSYLTANFTAIPLAWENEPFTVPEPPAPWALCEVVGEDFEQESIGSGSPAAELWRESGYLLVHVMVPAGSGSLVARQHAETLSNLLKGLELPAATRFAAMSIGAGELGDDSGAWWRLTLRADWIRD